MLHNKITSSSDLLLRWYDQHRRQMPWRALPGQAANPYHVWLSEIMLQQTTVVTVKPYFQKFIAIWPTVEHLSKASEDEVLTQWAGLGYYSRARNLYKCAQIVVDQYNGRFPDDIKSLITLPGIGDYTANAIRSIAFDKPATVVDGNVERVVSRIFKIDEPLPKAKKIIKEYAEKLISTERPSDYSQAIMDLGATICTPKNPKCQLCPWSINCQALQNGTQEQYPVKLPKKKRPKKYTTAFIFVNDEGAIFLRKRDDSGLLAGMMEVPSTPWITSQVKKQEDISFFKNQERYEVLPGFVKHVFTHLELIVKVSILDARQINNIEGVWVSLDDLDHYALPTLMKKIIDYALVKNDDSGIQENKSMVKSVHE